MYPHVQRYLSHWIPGSSLVPTVPGPYGIPDFTVAVEGEYRPVEVKCRPFRPQDLMQLKVYMDGMGARVGYAIAPSLRRDVGKLPRGVVFIPYISDERNG